MDDLEKIYRDAMHSVQADIERWYGRFAANNQISLSEARKMLTSGELEEFRWSVEQYIKIGQQADLSPEWIKKLENASARFHVSRLETIQLQIQQQVELLYGGQLDSLDGLLRDVVSNGYTRAAFEVQKGVGLAWDVTALNPRRLDSLLSKPWTADKKTFRDRCWEGKADLVSGVQSTLTQGLLRGDGLQKMTGRIKKQFKVSRYKAARLAHTETTYFNGVANREMYKDLGVERVEILETLDRHTCEICGPLDGKVIPLSQYEPGVTVPPFHPNCRGTTCPYFDDMAGERAARKPDGEVYYVPADTSYEDWKKSFVDGDKTEFRDELQKTPQHDTIAPMKGHDVTSEYLKAATPGKGAITYDEGYDLGLHKDEVQTASWLHDTFGGDIALLTESVKAGEKRADYLWNGKLWDLKTATTEKAANTAIKRGLAQIKSNPGGIILNYGQHDISLDELLKVINKRMQWLAEGSGADIMIVKSGRVVKILRYKK